MRLVDPDVLDDAKYHFDYSVTAPKKERWWNDDRVDLLIHHYRIGTHTIAIAKLLGTTKNAVIGKANALGLVHGTRRQ